jgi:hypothetical protein
MRTFIDYEFPLSEKVDSGCADVYEIEDDDSELYCGTMIYSQDLDQWNDADYPGDDANKDPVKCAEQMILSRRLSRK